MEEAAADAARLFLAKREHDLVLVSAQLHRTSNADMAPEQRI